MYFDEPAPRFEPMPIELRVVLGVSGAFILLFIFIAGQIGSAAELAAKTLF
jgi:NADH-quinone oxidoreductase subunit N